MEVTQFSVIMYSMKHPSGFVSTIITYYVRAAQARGTAGGKYGDLIRCVVDVFLIFKQLDNENCGFGDPDGRFCVQIKTHVRTVYTCSQILFFLQVIQELLR